MRRGSPPPHVCARGKCAAHTSHLGGRIALRMSSVWSALPLLSTPNVSFLPLALSFSRLLLTSTGLSYLTRLSTGGIILPLSLPLHTGTRIPTVQRTEI